MELNAIKNEKTMDELNEMKSTTIDELNLEQNETILLSTTAKETEITHDEESSMEIVNEIQRSEEELALEQQLNDVQKQLVALASLPSTIQATLDAVTRQLAELLPTFQLINSEVIENENIVKGKFKKILSVK